MEKSAKSCALLGAVPVFYYLFDYFTTIYTDILYRGTKWAVQFMHSIVSIFYFVFIILYYAETQKQANAQRERDMLAAQLQLAKTEFATLRRLQECTTVYRHDIRTISPSCRVWHRRDRWRRQDYLKTHSRISTR